ncbi:low affinity immunoglobulin gamma Fc region receptor II-c-like [Bufo bufo]|uniref:low affinity immunoglobulin gamma Fc region receptor II-c-like n=1 Tax=Bufo bufo TaxID=8384 RepID=UPI001ABE2114|nr:low affinity immunoglobulin gamma Fc region receptor II-c-like [Bufo bufo]
MSVLARCVILALTMQGLGVTVRPVVTFTPNWSQVLYHDGVTLTCDMGSALVENQKYYWYKDGKLMPDIRGKSFEIKHVGNKSEGHYQCRINNSDFSLPVTLDAMEGHLILQGPPVTYEGDPLTLRCHHVYGYLGTNTTFYKENKTIKFSVNDSELHIDTVDEASTGTYRCTKLLQHPNDHNYQCISAKIHILVLGRSSSKTAVHHIIIIWVTVGIVVVFLLLSLIFWKCRNKKTSLSTSQEQHATRTPMEADTHPALEDDICYTYLSMDHLQIAPSKSASKNVDMSTTYAEVKHRHH